MAHISEVLEKGPDVLGPLSSGSTFVYYATFNGSPLLRNGEWGPESSFSSEGEALAFAKLWAKNRGGQHHDPSA